MSKVVDWKARAERLLDMSRKLAGGAGGYHMKIDDIIRETEREESDVAREPSATPPPAMGFIGNVRPTAREIIGKLRDESDRAFLADRLVVKESLNIAHKRIDSLLERVNDMAKDRSEFQTRVKEFEASVESRFEILAEFVELVGRWAKKEKQSRGDH